MGKIKAVLFDLDDTLFDYQTVHDKTLVKLFDRISEIINMPIEMVKIAFELAQKEVKKQLIGTAASHNRDLYFQKLFELLNSKIKHKIEAKYIVELFRLYWDTFFKNIKKDKYAIKVLKFLKSNWIKTWIITDSQTYSQLKKMELLWISQYIDVLVTSEEAWIEKPHPSTFLLAAHKLWVLAKDCVMVWDNIERDIDWAQALWIKWVWLNRFNKENKWIRSNYEVSDTKELLELLDWKLIDTKKH